MRLLNTLILIVPSILGMVFAAYLLHEGKQNWGWFLFASLVMFGVGVANIPSDKELTKESE